MYQSPLAPQLCPQVALFVREGTPLPDSSNDTPFCKAPVCDPDELRAGVKLTRPHMATVQTAGPSCWTVRD